MKRPIKISNMVVTCKMPFKHKLKEKEVRRFINLSRFIWNVINEETSPIIMAHIEKPGITVHHTNKNACISLWTSGSMNITGIQSLKEAEDLYDKILKEIKKLCPRIMK